MKLFVNKDIERFFSALSIVLALFLTVEGIAALYRKIPIWFLVLSLLTALMIWIIGFQYFRRQNRLLEQGVSRINAYLSGDHTARIECDYEGELYKLFHSVNTLAAVLTAHATNELREKEFLKRTISDISHQLKTPPAALNIYNELLQNETEGLPEAQEFVALSLKELDRIDTLVQNLLKITRLDAGSIVLEKHRENVADMMRDIELHFAYRTRQEQKTLILSGSNHVFLWCDRDWLNEAIDNVVKNALDHTKAGDTVQITWQAFPSAVQIVVKDNGAGIHPEDLCHIFKRFYRSRFSQDTQGIGLGLPLAKAIIEAHNGAIEADSILGQGTAFSIYFFIPTKS